MRRLVLVLFACACVAGHAADAPGRIAVPTQQGAVTDLTGLLTPQAVSQLQNKIAALHQATGATLAVLMLPTTGEDDIAPFATRVFDAWKPGAAVTNNGLLMLIAVQDRRMRIEVGQGLEGQVPDLAANTIIDEQMKPRFRSQDFAGGIEAAIDALATRLGAGLPETQAAAPQDQEEHSDGLPALPPLLFAGLVLLAALAVGGATRTRGVWRWPVVVLPMAAGGGLIARFAHGEQIVTALLVLAGSAVGCGVLLAIAHGIRRQYRQSPRGVASRFALAAAAAAIAAIATQGDVEAAGFWGVLLLLLGFLPRTAGGASGASSDGNGGSIGFDSSSSSSSDSGSSSDSSSSSSDSGGSSSGGGSSGDW